MRVLGVIYHQSGLVLLSLLYQEIFECHHRQESLQKTEIIWYSGAEKPQGRSWSWKIEMFDWFNLCLTYHQKYRSVSGPQISQIRTQQFSNKNTLSLIANAAFRISSKQFTWNIDMYHILWLQDQTEIFNIIYLWETV